MKLCDTHAQRYARPGESACALRHTGSAELARREGATRNPDCATDGPASAAELDCLRARVRVLEGRLEDAERRMSVVEARLTVVEQRFGQPCAHDAAAHARAVDQLTAGDDWPALVHPGACQMPDAGYSVVLNATAPNNVHVLAAGALDAGAYASVADAAAVAAATLEAARHAVQRAAGAVAAATRGTPRRADEAGLDEALAAASGELRVAVGRVASGEFDACGADTVAGLRDELSALTVALWMAEAELAARCGGPGGGAAI